MPVCVLGVALGNARWRFDSGPEASRTEVRHSGENITPRTEGNRARHVVSAEKARVLANVSVASAPEPVTKADGEAIVASLPDLPAFASSEAEVAFLRARLPGTKLEHANFSRSLASMKSAIEHAPSAAERAELERRAAKLEARLEHQDALMAQMEGRIDELERSGRRETGPR
ncbi:MAG TPA: hypothetical protein VFZ53_34840 [Polyangiaceae bacterium]